MRRANACCNCWECPSVTTDAPVGGVACGQGIDDRQVPAAAQVQHAAEEPLPSLRPPPGVYAHVWHVSHLFPPSRLGGTVARRQEIELVGGWRLGGCMARGGGTPGRRREHEHDRYHRR